MVLLRVLLGLAGATAVLLTVNSALRTVVLPRGVPARLAALVFGGLRELYELRMRRARRYEDRDAIMSTYGPIALFVLLQVWLLVVWAGYTAIYLATGVQFLDAIRESGSSLLTLGFDRPPGTAEVLVAFTEAGTGLVLLALLITYLPSLYTAFSRREAAVTKLSVRAGEPPTGVELIIRATRLDRGDMLHQVWTSWEEWFVEVEETHTSFPALTFFRSPQPDHSWVTAAGAVLDGAALYNSTVDAERDIDADLCLRAGYLALRRVAAFFGLAYDPDPAPQDAISISRAEYDEAVQRMRDAGVPVRADTDAAWRDFAGWRVNYDAVLLSLATLTMAPYAPWSSDRSAAFRRPPVFRSGRRR
jgi:hypothetical protein